MTAYDIQPSRCAKAPPSKHPDSFRQHANGRHEGKKTTTCSTTNSQTFQLLRWAGNGAKEKKNQGQNFCFCIKTRCPSVGPSVSPSVRGVIRSSRYYGLVSSNRDRIPIKDHEGARMLLLFLFFWLPETRGEWGGRQSGQAKGCVSVLSAQHQAAGPMDLPAEGHLGELLYMVLRWPSPKGLS